MTEEMIEDMARYLAGMLHLSRYNLATYDDCSPHDRQVWCLIAEEALAHADRLRREEGSP